MAYQQANTEAVPAEFQQDSKEIKMLLVLVFFTVFGSWTKDLHAVMQLC